MEIIRCFCDIATDDVAGIQDSFITTQARKGELLLLKGDVCSRFFIVTSGAIRFAFQDEEGTLHTRRVLVSGTMGTSLESFISGNPSSEVIEALEDTTIDSIERGDFYSLVESNASWRRVYIRMLEAAYVFQNRQIDKLRTLDAADRFQEMSTDEPEVFRRVSNSVAASYVGIAPETLSRLKSKKN